MLRLLVPLASLFLISATPLPSRTDQWIYDGANIIDESAERALAPRLAELFQKTGVAIVVLTVPRLVDETISELAVRAGQTWGVGAAGQDRGLVVALARDEREIFVATGYGTEGFLPDGRVGGLIDEHAMPHLRAGRLSAGVVSLTQALVSASASEYGATLAGMPERAPRRDEVGLGTLVLIIVGSIGFLFLAWRHPMLAFVFLAGRMFGRGGGFGGGFGTGGFGGGGFGGGGAGRSF